ncbi:winged helix-turn-helix domain-containing protein [Phaeodactylibacter xiamenensis]|jgi:DNA-binding transcriptional ArsR family regulator|uniref:winged helix-turn-helix domain-containing protein n=1 Tax=Phaeodactylibacter xiamenensis TaxID=1524460 RepID=UPI0024A8722F|nr:winged helix-turn-helix domain-containing protein [Phaeodactylibacter xiamenensis]
MIETLISSKTRIKLLMKFFINSKTTSYLRGLQQEFGESSNAIRVELNRLEEAGMLRSETVGNKKMFRANDQHPLFFEIHNILLKQIGVDRVVEQVIERLGNVERVYLIGDFSRGIDSTIIDLLIIGTVDRSYLLRLVEKAEKVVNRKIRYLLYEAEEFSESMLERFTPEPLLLYFNKMEMN